MDTPDWHRIFTNLMNPDGPVRRMWPLYLLFLVCFAVVMAINPVKAGIVLFGIAKVLLGGFLGYMVDRFSGREADRPHVLAGIERGTAWKRRAWIQCACILAIAIGVP